MSRNRCPACDSTWWVPYRKVRRASIELCCGCGLGRTWPPPLPHSQDYGPVSMADVRERSRFRWQRIAQAQLDLLEPLRRLSAARPSLVDVGCSVGALVEKANEQGWAAIGFEPDWRACEIASDRVPVVHGFFVANAVLANTVHAVVTSHVLEHVDDPVAFLREIGNALAPGGELLVVCPNHAGWIASVQRSRWHGYAVEQHLWHFTPQTLTRVVERAGFAVRMARTRASWYASPLLPWLTQPMLDAGLRVASWLGLGDEIAVLGKRTPTANRVGAHA